MTVDFETYRPMLFAIAYRMLGSVMEAEDIVQEAYLRSMATDPNAIQSLKAYLSAIVTRLCLNQMQSARVRRESYVGPWLPEPILTGEESEAMLPETHLLVQESISVAFLILLEKLTPLERAVFVLREIFDYDYADIAEIVGKEEGACRQLLSRAKKHIAENRPRFKASPDVHQRMLTAFVTAVSAGDMDTLTNLLAEDVTLWADGGGKRRGAAIRPVFGRDAVAQFVMASKRFVSLEATSYEIAEVNGETALILRENGKPVVVMTFVVSRGHIQRMHFIANPDKLGRV